MALLNFGNNKRLYLIVAVMLAMGVIYWSFRKDVSPEPEQQLSPQLNEHSHTDVDTNTSTSPNGKSSRTQQLSSEAAPESGLVAAGETIAPDAWRVGDATIATPQIPLPEGVSVYEPVSVDMENPAYPEPGEQISVPMPGGEHLRVNVKTSTTNPNGDYTWRGHLDGYGDEYPVVMTYGGNSVYATVTTPEGSYTLLSINGSGWIYKNPSEFELSHPGTNDYLEIPHQDQ